MENQGLRGRRILSFSPFARPHNFSLCPKKTGTFSAGYNKQHKLNKGLTQFM